VPLLGGNRGRLPRHYHKGYDGLNTRRMAVLWTFREPSLARHVHREFMRNTSLNFVSIILTTACHQRNYIETYSRYMGELSELEINSFETPPCSCPTGARCGRGVGNLYTDVWLSQVLFFEGIILGGTPESPKSVKKFDSETWTR